MNYEVKIEDPLGVLESTRYVMEMARRVRINEKMIPTLAGVLNTKIEQGLPGFEEEFRLMGSFKSDIQLVFLEDVVNFCFWAERGKAKWEIDWQGRVEGGWYGLKKVFERALEKGVPIFNASFIEKLTLDEAREIFKGLSDIEIPLLFERVKNLNEAGEILSKRYDGQFINLIHKCGEDGIKIAKRVIEEFTSFRDMFRYDNRDIFFYKRAQILVNNLDYVYRNYYGKGIDEVRYLTAFADYKLPQILRQFEILEYSDSLQNKIDNFNLLKSGEPLEIEIRSAAIWAVELIRQYMPKYTAAQIDDSLWLLTQGRRDNWKPHHRCYSVYY